MKQKREFLKRKFSMMLAFALCVSGINIGPGPDVTAEAASEAIEIATADDLAKIGVDPAYPMDGDYILTESIDLSDRNWTPIGGADGPEYGLTSGERVFSGTLDGRGNVIEGLTIDYDGSASQQKTNQSGLFAMIGSESAADYAEVKNINFANVNITHSLGRGDTIGTLAADVDGYVKINNIAVLSGSINVNGSNGSDLIGVGGVVGQVRRNHSAVQMSNLYNAASVTAASNVPTTWARCGGILGRVHQSEEIGLLSSCLNVGEVTYKGARGYAINGISSSVEASANTANITGCYYLEDTGLDCGASTAITEAELGSQEVAEALGADYWEISNGRILPVISKGIIVTPIPAPNFAEGDKASSVTKNFTLPLSYTPETTEESITWTSSNPGVISINGAEATVYGVLSDTVVTLTATTASGKTKTVEVTVVSNLSISVDQEYAKPGTAITASVANAPEGRTFTYTWTSGTQVVSQEASYTPVSSDLNKFLTATASLDGSRVAELKIYCSKLPVVYINTDDNKGITSKTEYKGATMHIQGNDKYNTGNSTLYDGAISIRGRGNSTWNTGFSKLPYKIKLDSKTNLMGFGTSKHWALLANYMDESLIRNTTSYNLSGAMGMLYLPSAHVDVILNGVYAGNYQLVGNVRVEESRVNVYDWEGLAGDVAKAIGKAEGIKGDARDALEDYLNENMQWITSDSVTYNGTTYRISDYYTEIPKNEDGSADLSGGFLFELDEYYDEFSKFRTDSGQPIMFKSPEFISTNKDLFESARSYIQAVENSIRSGDFYTEYQDETKHYTDLVDMDSLVNYFVLNELYWNTETMKKSTYMYKDLGEKLFIGPVWDMDWTSNSIVSQGETSNYSVWMTTTASQNAQAEQWYRYLIGDPYFVTKVYECYQKNRQNFEDIVKTGGIIDQDQEYLAESAQANYNAGYLQHRSDFTTETERLRTFLTNRLAWLDTQFASVDNLLRSFGKYSASGNISITVNTENETTTTYTAAVSGSGIAKAGFYINGILAGTADVADGTAEYTAQNNLLTREADAYNTVQVRAMDASGNVLSDGKISNYAIFKKEIPADALSGNVTISGTAKTGAVLTAKLTGTNNTGTLSWQWEADGQPIEGATSETYQLTQAEIGKKIRVKVTSSVESGTLVSVETAAVVQEELKNDHIIINQVYGGGGNTETPVSHSFIELYNPTDKALSLEGCSLGYLSGGKNGPAAEEVKLSLAGSIPSHTSYLIRCEAQDASTPELITLNITEYDKEWSQTIDNKRYRLILYRGSEIEDGVSINEEAAEGPAIADGAISKQKAIRRKNFTDTNNNQADFETVVYEKIKTDEAAVNKNRPRSLADGEWDGSTTEPEDPVLTGTVSIRGNAVTGAILYADEATNNSGELSCQWYADGQAIEGATGLFYVIDKSCEGKTISLTVKSTAETGSLSCRMDSAVRTVQAQREHIIINQVYGGGQTSKGGAPVSHSFIELYNPTSETVSLEGCSIYYLSGQEEASLNLSGEIPAGTSYLIQCAEENAPKLVYTLKNADITWDQVIDNKQYSVVLKNGEFQIDGVSVNEAPVEGEPLVNPEGDEIISKNKAIRRIQFIDTDQNAQDFEVLNYSKLPAAILTDIAPRGTADGSWGMDVTIDPVDPVDPDKKNCEVIFDVDGNRTVVTVKYGETVSPAAQPEKNGYVFTGWYLGDKLYDFNTKVTENIVLTAVWKKSGVGTDMEPAALAAPAVTAVKSVISKKASRVRVNIAAVSGASSYEIYRRKGTKTVLVGTAAGGTFYDENPVSGKVFYLAKAVNGSVKSGFGAEKSITLPKAVKKVTVKAVKGKKSVSIKWKRVKGATGYMVYRSTKKNSGYKRIAVIRKAKKLTWTDKKVKKGKKYYYRVVTVKKKVYSPAKTSKAVKVK